MVASRDESHDSVTISTASHTRGTVSSIDDATRKKIAFPVNQALRAYHCTRQTTQPLTACLAAAVATRSPNRLHQQEPQVQHCRDQSASTYHRSAARKHHLHSRDSSRKGQRGLRRHTAGVVPIAHRLGLSKPNCTCYPRPTGVPDPACRVGCRGEI